MDNSHRFVLNDLTIKSLLGFQIELLEIALAIQMGTTKKYNNRKALFYGLCKRLIVSTKQYKRFSERLSDTFLTIEPF